MDERGVWKGATRSRFRVSGASEQRCQTHTRTHTQKQSGRQTEKKEERMIERKDRQKGLRNGRGTERQRKT